MVQVHAHLWSNASMALATGETACASIDAATAEKFKAINYQRGRCQGGAEGEPEARAQQRGMLRAVPRAADAADAQASRDRRRVIVRGHSLRRNDFEFVRLGASFPSCDSDYNF